MRDRSAKLQVIQIIPADGWFARYIDASEDSPDNVSSRMLGAS
jgi:hypothetical protein